MKTTIDGDKIKLRPLSHDDRSYLEEMETDSWARTMNGNEEADDSNRGEGYSVMDNYILVPSNDSVTFAIESDSGEFCGIITTHHCHKEAGYFKYGLTLRAGFRRKGHASKAVRAVLGYYFGVLGYKKAIAEVYSFNQISAALHEKLGFRCEGCQFEAIEVDGIKYSSIIYAITDEEFRLFNR